MCYNDSRIKKKGVFQMKLALANQIRADFIKILLDYFTNRGEDVGMIASNVLNFPTVIDGEECWVEVSVKVPKGTKDEEYDGYGRREDYIISLEDKADKAAKKEAEKAAKLAKQAARKKAKEEKAE